MWQRRPSRRGAVAAIALLGGWGLLLEAASGAAADTAAIFVDRAAETGLDFVHFNGMSGEFYFAETAGSGGALFDYDHDGDLDVYLVQTHMLGPGKSPQDALFPPQGELRDRLFRNDLSMGADGSPVLRFTEVTEQSGIRAEGYGMGVATGDFDNDGWTDLYVTNFGSNQLWRNNGDGTFSDVTSTSGADDIRWSVPATWLDFDRDGWLDLFVGNYVDFTIGSHKLCRTIAGAPDYCGPLAFNPLPDRLLRNRGDGTFEDRSASAGIDQDFGAALGAVAADLDGDGWQDLYVGNDGTPNQMWMNQRDGTFLNQALLAGTAVNMVGEPEASMGVSIADFDADGDEDIFLTHLIRETNTVYVNDGSGLFEDATTETGLGAPSWLYTGFGTAWLDFDNDGWLDLVVANGAVEVVEELAAKRDPYPLHQPNQLYRNQGGRFVEVSASAGAVFALSEVSRGLATGDLDNDGDLDVVLFNNSAPARLLINQVGSKSHWVGVEPVLANPRQSAHGSKIGVLRSGERELWRRYDSGGSYAAASDPKALIGTGASASLDEVVVVWPSGARSSWRLPIDRKAVVFAGPGTARAD